MTLISGGGERGSEVGGGGESGDGGEVGGGGESGNGGDVGGGGGDMSKLDGRLILV